MPRWLALVLGAVLVAVLTIVGVPHLPAPADEIFTWVGWIIVIGLLIYAAFDFFGRATRV